MYGMLTAAAAQVNSKGTFQVALGLTGGAHATEFTYSFRLAGIPLSGTNTDAAATVAYPIEVQGGISDRFSLGITLEPGRYIDSAGTRPNGFFVASLSPRFYAVNGEHFALHLNADVGVGVLRIGEVNSGMRIYDDTYAGGHFRLGVQAQYFFGRVIGVHLGMKYAAHTLRWRDREPEDPLLTNTDYTATLRTSGLLFQLGLQARF